MITKRNELNYLKNDIFLFFYFEFPDFKKILKENKKKINRFKFVIPVTEHIYILMTELFDVFDSF